MVYFPQHREAQLSAVTRTGPQQPGANGGARTSPTDPSSGFSGEPGRDSIVLNPSEGGEAGSVPNFETWAGGGGVAGTTSAPQNSAEQTANIKLQGAVAARLSGSRTFDQAGRNLGTARTNGSQQQGIKFQFQGRGAARRHRLGSLAPGRRNSLDGNGSGSGLAGNAAMTPAGAVSVNPGAGTSARLDSLVQPRTNDGDLSVKRNQQGRQRLQEVSQHQGRDQEQAGKTARNDIQASRALGDQARQYGQAQQSLLQNAGQNMQSGAHNLQLAGQNTQHAQDAHQQNLVEKLLAAAQQKIEELEKAREAQGKTVEKTGQATVTQGKAISTTGRGVHATGVTTQAQGQATQATGVGMQGTGEGMMATGAALAAGVFTAPAGAALLAAGTLLDVEGVGLQAVGEGLQATGQGLKAQGKTIEATGRQTQTVGKQIKARGHQEYTKAKTAAQKAKSKRQQDLDLAKRALKMMKKFLEEATKNKGDAAKNFADAGRDRQHAGQDGRKRDQDLGKAKNANTQASHNDERAHKAKDNLHALNEALRKAFGNDAGAHRGRQQSHPGSTPELGSGTPSAGDGGGAGAGPAGEAAGSPDGRQTDDRKRKKKQNLDILARLDARNREDGRRQTNGQVNPAAASRGGHNGQGGQGSGDDRPRQHTPEPEQDGEVREVASVTPRGEHPAGSGQGQSAGHHGRVEPGANHRGQGHEESNRGRHGDSHGRHSGRAGVLGMAPGLRLERNSNAYGAMGASSGSEGQANHATAGNSSGGGSSRGAAAGGGATYKVGSQNVSVKLNQLGQSTSGTTV